MSSRRSSRSNAGRRPQQALLLGVGLDNDDGHFRITRGENLCLVSGSQETHERMQEHAIQVNQELERRGKELGECSIEELTDVFREAAENC